MAFDLNTVSFLYDLEVFSGEIDLVSFKEGIAKPNTIGSGSASALKVALIPFKLSLEPCSATAAFFPLSVFRERLGRSSTTAGAEALVTAFLD